MNDLLTSPINRVVRHRRWFHRIIPMQAWRDNDGGFERLRCDANGSLHTTITGQEPVESMMRDAPKSTDPVSRISTTVTIVYQAVPDLTQGTGINLYNGDGDSDLRWQIVPGFVPSLLAPLVFPNGLSIRAITGLVVVPILIQMVEAA